MGTLRQRHGKLIQALRAAIPQFYTPKATSTFSQTYKIRHERVDKPNVFIEKTIRQWRGVQCLCGCDKFYQKTEITALGRVPSFQCTACRGRPILCSRVDIDAARDALIWLGLIKNPYKV